MRKSFSLHLINW